MRPPEGAALYVLPSPILEKIVEQDVIADTAITSVQSFLFLTACGLSKFSRKVVGTPADEILKYARAWHADVIVIGSGGHCADAGKGLGSVAQAVVSQKPCAVLVVHPLCGRSAQDSTKAARGTALPNNQPAVQVGHGACEAAVITQKQPRNLQRFRSF